MKYLFVTEFKTSQKFNKLKANSFFQMSKETEGEETERKQKTHSFMSFCRSMTTSC